MQQQAGKTKTKLESVLEVLAVVAPIICLVDCIVIPFVLAILPFVGIQNVFHGVGDQFLALIVLLICAPVLVPGYLQHRKIRVILFMSVGFAFIFSANFLGHVLDQTVHALLTLSGSCFLIKANMDNKRFRKTACCSGCNSTWS